MKKFKNIPQNQWRNIPKGLFEVWTNKDFLVQINKEASGIRITINKLKHKVIKGEPIWDDGISWDQIQEIKSLVGYGDKWAVECFPPDQEVVNVANMRHIWILNNPPEYGWHK
jgi:hypothetical protein